VSNGEVKLKFKYGAKFKLRNSPEVVAFLENMGAQARDEANETLPEGVGYRMSSSRGTNFPYGRWTVNVYTSSNHAKRSNAVHNTLLRVIG
jgi:hypothetical protein